MGYADDFILFCKATNKSILCAKKVVEELIELLIKELPMNYLGAPITGRSVRPLDCLPLINSLQDILTRWEEGKCLSYAGRTQLVQWIFQGKFHYLLQSTVVPRSVVEKIKSISYKFFWRRQREVAWRSMIYPKGEGGVGWGFETVSRFRLQR